MEICTVLLEDNLIVLRFPRFSREPDGGLCWPGSTVPCIVIEIGVSDTIEKDTLGPDSGLLKLVEQ